VTVSNGTWHLKLCSRRMAPAGTALLRPVGFLCALAVGVIFFLQQRHSLKRTLKIEYLNRDLVVTTNALLEEKQKLEKAAEEIKTLKGISCPSAPIARRSGMTRGIGIFWKPFWRATPMPPSATVSARIVPNGSTARRSGTGP